MPHRVEKVSAQLRAELSEILEQQLRDPRLGLVTVVEVDVSPDLANARVHVSRLGSDEERAGMMAALEHASGYIRHELAARLRGNLRRVPALSFVDDRNIEYATHIGEVLRALEPTEGDVEG
jgi:ribosome-binding factor A